MAAPSELILVFNSGSSSLKAAAFSFTGDDPQLLLSAGADGIGRDSGTLQVSAPGGTVLLSQEHVTQTQEAALERIVPALAAHLPGPITAVGHRVVHGGPHLRTHQRITPQLLTGLESVTHFAPLHIPESLRTIRKAQQLLPDVPHFACFDTTFHSTMPDRATHLPLPARLFDEGIQRYGFHGLSCESIVTRLRSSLPRRLVIAHLGGGASVTAVLEGRSVDTTMSMSPTGGVPSSTRSGDLDPAILLYLMRTGKLTTDGVETLVNHECGVAGLSGGTSDMKELLARREAGDAAASLAFDVFTSAIQKAVGGFCTVLDGIDLLVFTGGIGEHSEAVRSAVCKGLASLGLASDASGGNPRVRSMPAEEEQEIARHCHALLRTGG